MITAPTHGGLVAQEPTPDEPATGERFSPGPGSIGAIGSPSTSTAHLGTCRVMSGASLLIARLLAQPYARVEDCHHDVGQDRADQDADAAEGGHGDGAVARPDRGWW